jgi:NAD(P)H-flavin reductase
MSAVLSQTRPEPVCGMESWVPTPARILKVRNENFNTRTFTMQFVDEYVRNAYRFVPGQFNMVYAPGVGEAAISISSNPHQNDTFDHTIRIVGTVTQAVGRLQAGDVVGIRGPFGTGWPLNRIEGKDLVILAGGIGLAPLRPVIYWLLQHRDHCRRVVLLYGCRTPEDRLFAEELDCWANDPSLDVLVTVDNATLGWTGPVGVVTNLMRRVKVSAQQTIVLVCGPRILNRVAAWNFLQLHVPPSQVYVSLERNMNCGFGRCGHCQYGPKFVCKDGPVFCFTDIADIFAKEEI